MNKILNLKKLRLFSLFIVFMIIVSSGLFAEGTTDIIIDGNTTKETSSQEDEFQGKLGDDTDDQSSYKDLNNKKERPQKTKSTGIKRIDLKNLLEKLEKIPILVVLGISLFTLIIAIIALLSTNGNKKKIKDEIERRMSSIDELKNEQKDLAEQIRQSINSAPLESFTTRINGLEEQIENLEGKFRQQQIETSTKANIPININVSKEEDLSSPERILSCFNDWASNPHTKLPQAFYYIKGDVKIRTNMQLLESDMPTKWIVNRICDKKYLFPNPNTFDDRTDIKQIYDMDLKALKPKGQNRIKIIKPCEMTDKGFIEFKGELQLLN